MMSDLTAKQFVAKWSQIQQSERATVQSHFLDVCRLIGHPTPHEYDPSGERFSFETRTLKADGQKGFADVYFRGRFIWEYKGPHRDLQKAYQQLLLYRDALDNPPRPPSNVIDVAYQRMLKDRTLTNLYNGLVYYRENVKQGKFFDTAEYGKVTRNSVTREEMVELDDIHVALDAAVAQAYGWEDAYGWPQTLTGDEILERLLALNLERTTKSGRNR